MVGRRGGGWLVVVVVAAAAALVVVVVVVVVVVATPTLYFSPVCSAERRQQTATINQGALPRPALLCPPRPPRCKAHEALPLKPYFLDPQL